MGYALRRMWLPQRVASLLWNQWQVCRGMRGNFAMESVASFAWNQWQLSYGTGGNFRAEYATLHTGRLLLPTASHGLATGPWGAARRDAPEGSRSRASACSRARAALPASRSPPATPSCS